jgi:hypothetical protein
MNLNEILFYTNFFAICQIIEYLNKKINFQLEFFSFLFEKNLIFQRIRNEFLLKFIHSKKNLFEIK